MVFVPRVTLSRLQWANKNEKYPQEIFVDRTPRYLG